MSCVTVPTLASDGMELWEARTSERIRKKAQPRRYKRRNINQKCSVYPDAPRSPNRPQSNPRVNSLLTMAKGRLAEHFREIGLVCCGSVGLSPPRAEAPFLLSFGVVLAPAAGSTAYAESADGWAAKYLRLNQTIGSGGIGATLQTYWSATEEKWKVERRRPSRGRT